MRSCCHMELGRGSWKTATRPVGATIANGRPRSLLELNRNDSLKSAAQHASTAADRGSHVPEATISRTA